MLGGAVCFVCLGADAALVQCLQAAGCNPSSPAVVANAGSSSAKAARDACVCVGEKEEMSVWSGILLLLNSGGFSVQKFVVDINQTVDKAFSKMDQDYIAPLYRAANLMKSMACNQSICKQGLRKQTKNWPLWYFT